MVRSMENLQDAAFSQIVGTLWIFPSSKFNNVGRRFRFLRLSELRVDTDRLTGGIFRAISLL